MAHRKIKLNYCYIVKSHGYSVLQNTFLDGRRGGGAAVIFKNGLEVNQCNLNINITSFEFTTIWIKTDSMKIILTSSIYRTGPLISVFSQELDLFLAEISSKSDDLIIAGDLNIHFELDDKGIEKHIIDIFRSYGFKKLVCEPTHKGGGHLDQVFCFSLNKQMTYSIYIDPLLSLGSDHYPVFCEFNVNLSGKYFKEIQTRQLKSIDQGSFSNTLNNILYSFTPSLNGFGSSIDSISLSLNKLLDDHAPVKKKIISVVDKAPWFDKEYRYLRKLRRKAEKKKHLSPDALCHYQDICKQATSLAILKKKAYFTNVIDRSQNNTRTLYTLVNKALDQKQAKTLPEGTDLGELAEKFNSFFVEKIEKLRKNGNMNCKPRLSQTGITPLCEFQPTTIDELKEIISKSGIKCSPADMLPQPLIKDNMNSLLPVYVQLVNQSLATGSMEGVKLADIAPSLKDDSLDPNDLANYRPISNLTFLGKLIERVVLKRLEEHMVRNSLNCPEQAAYKAHHSTETILLKITDDILIAADEQTSTVVMLLDLSAAFDTVDHNLLLKILKSEIGIHGTALAWFASFLRGRAQRIRLGLITSDSIIIKFGVPQGSVLGPVLFNIYIRSIYKVVKMYGFNIFGYADDHQVMKAFTAAKQTEVLTIHMIDCFSAIKKWMQQYYLTLNDSKTQIIVFGPSKVLQQLIINGVCLSVGTNIRFIPVVKNLGVQLDNRLTFEKQICTLKKKAFHTMRNIRKIRYLLSEDQLKIIVNSMVLSCIDYCNSLYFGIAERLLKQLQLIQNAAAKAITGKYKYDHVSNDLHNLHWLEVKKRIIFKIGLLAYKAVNGYAPEHIQDMFRYSHHGHTLKLIVPRVLSKYGQRSFQYIGPKVFNNLPTQISAAENCDQFKKLLKTYLFELPVNDISRLTR